MKYRKPAVLFIIVLTAALPPLCADPGPQSGGQRNDGSSKPQSKGKAKEKSSALTGCLDEKGGHYVLVDDRSLSTIASLQAEGFPTEGFAKYLGHKVTVRGILIPDSAGPTFKVRSVETVSDTCEPHR